MKNKLHHWKKRGSKIQLKKQYSLSTAKKKKEPKKRHPLTKMANYCNLKEAYGTKTFYNNKTVTIMKQHTARKEINPKSITT